MYIETEDVFVMDTTNGTESIASDSPHTKSEFQPIICIVWVLTMNLKSLCFRILSNINVKDCHF